MRQNYNYHTIPAMKSIVGDDMIHYDTIRHNIGAGFLRFTKEIPRLFCINAIRYFT